MNKLDAVIRETIEPHGYFLYGIEEEVQHKKLVLRVLIEKDGSISLDDCVKVSEMLSDVLDKEDPFEDPYMLEVSSAGAERELRTLNEVERAVGKGVFVQTYDQSFEGQLMRVKDSQLTIKLPKGKEVTIQYIDVSLIRLAIIL